MHGEAHEHSTRYRPHLTPRPLAEVRCSGDVVVFQTSGSFQSSARAWPRFLDGFLNEKRRLVVSILRVCPKEANDHIF